MKILIYGNGWIGNILKNYYQELGWEANISFARVGLTPKSVLADEIRYYDVVINAFAKTQIDWCEENKVGAFEDNVLGAVSLATVVREQEKQYVNYLQNERANQ